MVKKKAASSKLKKTSKRQTSRKTATAKAKLEDSSTRAASGGATPGDTSVEATKAAAAASTDGEPRRPRRKSGRRRKAAGAETGRGRAIQPVSPLARVDTEDDAIVIRFPSAAPQKRSPALETADGPISVAIEQPKVEPSSPAAPAQPRDDARETRARPPHTEATPAERARPAVDEEKTATDERSEDTPQTGRRKRRRRRKSAARPGSATDGEGSEAVVREERETEKLSHSQLRRLRRKRKKPSPVERVADEADAGAAEEAEAGVEAGVEADWMADLEIDTEDVKGLEDEEAAETKPADEAPARRGRRGGRRGRGSAGRVRRDAAPSAEDEVEIEEEKESEKKRKEMIINVSPREECRIGILEAAKLEEIYLERASSENYVGNIYKGVVTNVESSIQAAFVDFGMGKNGFLHISDLHPDYFPKRERQTETVGNKMPRRSRPPIQQCLRRGQEMLVQITKVGIGTKGPTLTTYLSIPGRFLVMLPGMRRVGVSRKIEDDDLRYKLRKQLSELELPGEIGFIARTAAAGRTRRELQSDLRYLSRLWQAVKRRIDEQGAPAELYRESDLVIRTIRDVYASDIDRIVVDNEEVAQRAREFLSIFSPRSRDIVVTYDDPQPIFHKYGIEAELERLHSRHVPLKSGGSLVIDQTEALVAIDVNSGSFRSEDDAETTAYKINAEAAGEIARQLRLRDMGGVVVCDFIDMRMERHKRDIERRLTRNLKAHKERAKVLRTSEFGLIELTRQRQRTSLTRNVYQDCHSCRGTGLVKTAESVTLDIMRLIQLAVTQENIRTIEIAVSSEVGFLLLNRKRWLLHEFETKNNRTIAIRSNAGYGLDQFTIQCYDHRGRVVPYSYK